MKNNLLIAAVLMLASLHVNAYEDNAFNAPITHGDFVIDVENMLDMGVARNGWRLSKKDGSTDEFYADLDYKTYVIRTLITTANNTIQINLVSAERPNCTGKKCKVDDDKVQGWLLRLRRLVGNELATAARNDAKAKLKVES